MPFLDSASYYNGKLMIFSVLTINQNHIMYNYDHENTIFYLWSEPNLKELTAI